VQNLLITGGAGFIGSHACSVLLEAGYGIIVLDNFSYSKPDALERVRQVVGPSFGQHLRVVQGDVRYPEDLNRAFSIAGPVLAVLHFAGLKAVAESILNPLHYWDVNVSGAISLLQAMRAHSCRTLVFSSSATLYGFPEHVPIPESAPLMPINAYGATKAAVERLLADLVVSETGWRVACLRYFNPIGAHSSGMLGENPSTEPTNLFPILGEIAHGKRSHLDVYGTDWPTRDGSGIRDYIHVMDLVEGHLHALETLLANSPDLWHVNLGTGLGTTVLELRQTFERVSGKSLPWVARPRRPGDAAASIADVSKASQLLHWRAKRSLNEMCEDGWKWLNNRTRNFPTIKI
jgi:UDP-glucose 4-epimerase